MKYQLLIIYLVINYIFILISTLKFPQVTCEYILVHGACIPQRVHTVVISVQHSEKIFLGDLRKEVMSKVIKTVIPSQYLDDNTIFHINPCGKFVMGGPQVILYSI